MGYNKTQMFRENTRYKDETRHQRSCFWPHARRSHSCLHRLTRFRSVTFSRCTSSKHERKKSTAFSDSIVWRNWWISPRAASNSLVISWREDFRSFTFRRRSNAFWVDKCHFSEKILSFSLEVAISLSNCKIKLPYNLTSTSKVSSGCRRLPNRASRCSWKNSNKELGSGLGFKSDTGEKVLKSSQRGEMAPRSSPALGDLRIHC